MYTVAPASTKPRAIISPIPREPPVTSTVFPSTENRFFTLASSLHSAYHALSHASNSLRWARAARYRTAMAAPRDRRAPAPSDPDAGIWQGQSVARRFVSPEGFVILVGRTAADNDVLTF